MDRAALEVAKESGIPIEGWCPKDGWAEDMQTPPGIRALYPELKETPLKNVAQRTVWNVRDSDATLVIKTKISPGTDLTERAARIFHKPYLVTNMTDIEEVKEWLSKCDGDIRLNIGGPRESEDPGIKERAKTFLRKLF